MRAAQVAGLSVAKIDADSSASSAARLRAGRRRSKWRRSTGRPTPTWRPATATPESSSPSSPGSNPLAVIPVAILLGGIDASGGLLQRRLNLPDATVLVLQGILFVVILASKRFTAGSRCSTPSQGPAGRQRRRTGPGAGRAVDRPKGARRAGAMPVTHHSIRGGPCLNPCDRMGLWGVPLAMFAGAIRVSTPFLFVSLGETPDREERADQPRAGGDAGDGGDERLRRLCLAPGSPWLGVLAAGAAGVVLGHAARLALQPPARERRRGRHRADALRHRAGVLPGQAATSSRSRRKLPAIPLGFWSHVAAGAAGAADQRRCS